ncbi:hypothetical protein Nepgr_016603 [Nepenthes gracilis]|uniref:Uncharacterized protein n=1 Tax=Nepenthes gracilis TaxID=150966 RepID=A0AAD3SQR1_NEPGR|nr:hypothetical protein Nepgr_016603 [Nepenthes gracilis]
MTAVDLAAFIIDLKAIYVLQSLRDSIEPLLQLMESLPSEEKLVLIGHRLGGLCMPLTTVKFPWKIEVAVFLATFMLDTIDHHHIFWYR